MTDTTLATPVASTGKALGVRSTHVRRVVHRTAGQTHGFITRLMSPGDLGELVKPFVFLDFFETEHFQGAGIPAHPHSGIATHTTLLRGSIRYADSTGKSGVLQEGSVEWMQAGGGVWHAGAPSQGDAVKGYQLWIALPPELENAPAESRYVDASAIETDGRVRLLLGAFGTMDSPIAPPSPIACLHVRLRNGERWRYQPPSDHDVAWVAVNEGRLHVAGTTLQREMAVFEGGNGALEFIADGSTELMLGSAAKHPHPLVCGSYSVHTSETALIAGEAGIRRMSSAAHKLGVR